ncbi:MAG: nuclear transport factor 2 family protein [Novosphingobium sp.]|nr:nuclear transport factor 2 family protein [Novosphingobium sp.]
MSDGAIIDRMYAALGSGDIDAALACYTPDALIWHGFDCVAHDLDAIRPQWVAMKPVFPVQELTDIRREPIAGGFVQRHLWVVHMANGERKAWPVCIFVTIRNGRISRLDEYIDRAGTFEPQDDGPLATPGLEPA